MKTKYLYRLLFLSSFLFILFFFIVLQFYQLQITDEKKWSSCAKAQHQFSVIEPFRRGRFFSNSDLHQSHFEKELPFLLTLLPFQKISEMKLLNTLVIFFQWIGKKKIHCVNSSKKDATAAD